MTDAERKELNELRAFKAKVEPMLHNIYDYLYFDTEAEVFDPDKEWDSACDYLEAIASEVTAVMPLPKAGTTEYPKIKGL
ncbi:MAG: hypothetical protein WC869_00065 [Phycisphaerae bacterium]|jgi:hypothetical protein